MKVRNKCKTPSYLLYGEGKAVSRHTYTLIFILPLSSYFQYQIFIPMVNKVMLKHRINHQRYDILICRIVKVWLASKSRLLLHIFHTCLVDYL